MATQQQINEFKSQMYPYALKAGQALGMSPEFVLGQWALESAYGTSTIAKKAGNYAGIRYTSHADYKYSTTGNGAFSGYNTLTNFVNDYIRVMGLSFYDKVRQATTMQQEASALESSPYDANGKADHYGTHILNVVKTLFGNTTSVPTEPVNNMSTDDLKKYALIGLALVTAVSLANK